MPPPTTASYSVPWAFAVLAGVVAVVVVTATGGTATRLGAAVHPGATPRPAGHAADTPLSRSVRARGVRRFAVASVAVYDELPPYRQLVLDNHEEYCREHGYAHEILRTTSVPQSPSWRANANKSQAFYNARREQRTWLKLPLVEALLLSGYEAVLTVDMDAVIVNSKVTIESILVYAQSANVLLTGDTLLVNAAQVLYLNTPWTLQWLRQLYDFPPLIMPLMESGAMAAWFGGCSSTSPPRDLQACYRAANQGWLQPHVARVIKRGAWQQPRHSPLFRNASVLHRRSAHVRWLPQRVMNSYPKIWMPGVSVVGYGPHHIPGFADRKRWLREAARLLAAVNRSDPGVLYGIKDKAFLELGGIDVSCYHLGDFIVHGAGHQGASEQSVILYYLLVAALRHPAANDATHVQRLMAS